MQELRSIRLKLFVRRDLFRRITQGQFVNLTHINARKREIIWDEEDLKSLLCKRVRENADLREELGLDNLTDDALFDRLFPDQVDFGKRKPKTWVWMMRRIRDGNDVKPPRNLIDLVSLAVQAQIRSEVRTPREDDGKVPLIESDALRRALKQLSNDRVADTLLAEAKGYAESIEFFRRGKSEHNESSIAEVLGLPLNEARSIIKALVELGFLERIKGTYKIPTLYREGLEITQGKAFGEDETEEEDE
jgi:hypothetical protein